MGKAKRAAKRARREARGTAKEREFLEAERAAERRARRRRRVLLAVPLVTALAAAGFYFGLEDVRAAGIALLVGALVFLLYGLGTLGSSVQPRNRGSAGSIDFGNRR
ncbi:MAG: hypothetical protein ACODAU_02935 [Myxococcota bacterium]